MRDRCRYAGRWADMGTACTSGHGLPGERRYAPPANQASRAGYAGGDAGIGRYALKRAKVAPERCGPSTWENKPLVRGHDRDREELIETLRHGLDFRNRETSRLHDIVARQAQAIEQTTALLPAPQATSLGDAEQGVEQSMVEADEGGLWRRIRRFLAGT